MFTWHAKKITMKRSCDKYKKVSARTNTDQIQTTPFNSVDYIWFCSYLGKNLPEYIDPGFNDSSILSSTSVWKWIHISSDYRPAGTFVSSAEKSFSSNQNAGNITSSTMADDQEQVIISYFLVLLPPCVPHVIIYCSSYSIVLVAFMWKEFDVYFMLVFVGKSRSLDMVVGFRFQSHKCTNMFCQFGHCWLGRKGEIWQLNGFIWHRADLKEWHDWTFVELKVRLHSARYCGVMSRRDWRWKWVTKKSTGLF